MTDLTPAVWKEIEAAAIWTRVNDVSGWYISVGNLRTIIKKSRRSNSQNALAWVLYQKILDRGGEAMRGWVLQDLHDFFLIRHFGADKIEAFGMKRLKPKRRSSRLTKAEFSDYLESIVTFMAEQGVALDLPGDLI